MFFKTCQVLTFLFNFRLFSFGYKSLNVLLLYFQRNLLTMLEDHPYLWYYIEHNKRTCV